MQGKEGFPRGQQFLIPRTSRPDEAVLNRLFPTEALTESQPIGRKGLSPVSTPLIIGL